MDASSDPQSAKDLAIERVGSTFARRWKLESLIGMGGMAAVYRSCDSEHGPVALKVLHSEFAENTSVRDRFLREARLTRAVDHPGRVAIFDDGISDWGDAYFVMELLEGVPLDKLWKKRGRKLPAEYALRVADRALELLAVCHEQGIVHRDLKPANLFITKTGQVKVLDFGVARKREDGVDPTMVGTALGTPAYMAPEQAMGTREALDGRADIFSVGAVLQALITGKKLHQGRSEQEAFVLAATRPAPSVARAEPGLIPELIALIDRALQWDRRNRFPDAEAMRTEIANVLVALRDDESASTREVSSSRRLLASASQADDQGPESVGHSEKIEAISELFRNLERALAAVRQYGAHHPMPVQRVEHVQAELTQLFGVIGGPLAWEVAPHSFSRGGATIWEPIHPFDQVPYNLFASGFRSMTLLPGITADELGELLDLMRKDPLRDFAPEDDLATAFWERRFTHVEYQVVSSFIGNANNSAVDWEDDSEEDDLELDSLIDHARTSATGLDDDVEELSLEARAVAIAARAGALQAVRAEGALSLNAQQRASILHTLDLPAGDWSERLDVALTDVALFALDIKQTPTLAEALRARVEMAETAVEQIDALRLLIRLQASITRARPDAENTLVAETIGDSTLRHLLRTIEAAEADLAPSSGSDRDSIPPVDSVASVLPEVMACLDGRFFDAALGAFTRARRSSTRRALGGYLRRHARGNEADLGATLAVADDAKARAIMRILADVATPAAAEALRAAEQNASPKLRVEAVALRAAASAEGLRDELAQLTRDPDGSVRRAALETMARHNVIQAGPLLAQLIQSSGFHKLPTDERELAIATLHTLSPTRAAAVLIEVASKNSVISRGAAVDTRIVAIESLGRFANDLETETALTKIEKKWSNPESVRAAAAAAAVQVRSRAQQAP